MSFLRIKLTYSYKHEQKQQGVILMIMLILLIVGSSTFLVSAMNNVSVQNERDQKTAATLAQAKEALISYAINSENAGGATARPGNFPCPDTDAPGTSGYGDAQPSCSSGGGTTIGRLPWKTLGIPELVDANGESLWYAISDNFRKSVSIINSDTLGTLQVYDRDGTTLLTPPGSEAVAIIFAPGTAVANQQRNNDSNKKNASNYLDTALGQNNATSAGPFISTIRSDSFNDQLIIIRTRDFIPAIEKRIGKELKTIFEKYYVYNGVYPYPAPFNTCQDNTTCNSSSMICRGRFPYTASPANWGGSYSLPKTAGGSDWFVINKWYRVIYYSISSVMGCSSTLNVSGQNPTALFFMPGTPLGNITRTYPNNNLSWYLEDAANTDFNNTYVTPSANSNDQIYELP